MCACGSGPSGLDEEDLSNLLAISNVSKSYLSEGGDPGLISGVVVNVDIVNIGAILIDVPFKVTWVLRDPTGDRYAHASQRVDQGLGPGQRLHLTITLRFPPLASLQGYGDAVTFDLIDS
jgi:hypothetical protein